MKTQTFFYTNNEVIIRKKSHKKYLTLLEFTLFLKLNRNILTVR
jgi:hypothetical protein